MTDLFEAAGMSQSLPDVPLAERLRPRTLADIVGQERLLGPEGALSRMIAAGKLTSMILWGPPGVGKTTLARLLAEAAGYEFQSLSAVFSGVADLKKAFETAKIRRGMGKATLLFVDEIHRFNRAQQDGFLPYVEAGIVTLVGATTENPSFELNGALLSRCQVLILERLSNDSLEKLLQRAEAHLDLTLPLDDAARATLIGLADGDGRHLLTLAEAILAAPPAEPLTVQGLLERVQRKRPAYDKDRDGHYNLISALHKSVRGSDPDAALYWFARMLDGGEDPLYIARRLVRMAVEDIGLADPRALMITTAAKDAYDFLGSPEGELALAQAVVHLACAPKSVGVYKGFKAAMRAAKATGSLSPPAHILNAPTKLMKDIGYGQGYAYDPDTPEGFSGQNYFPDEMPRQIFYAPRGLGEEAKIKDRLEHWASLRAEKSGDPDA